MKKLILFFLLICCFSASKAQNQKMADSLAGLLRTAKQDTSKVNYMWKMADYLYSYNPDSAIRIAQKALFLAQHIKYEEGESRSMGLMANGFLAIGNYPRALEFYLKKLKLEEKRSNPYNLASATMNIGIVYVYQEEYNRALYYFRRADSIITANNIPDINYNIKLNLGDVYDRQKMNDSAFLYFGAALAIARQMNDGDFIGTAMIGLGHSNLKASNLSLSASYYKEAIPYLKAAGDEDLLCEATLGLAKLYKALNNPDSATWYAQSYLALARKDGFQSRQLDASNFLTEMYTGMQVRDSAFAYLLATQALGDSINSREKIRDSQILSINEQLRQDELAETARRAKEERSQQLQLLFIGIFIPALFLFTLLLSRGKVHVRIIKFSGIISLLILFEYLTLLLHPIVVSITHHTPLLELLIFVAIASLLIPAHHRIEHWLIEKLTLSGSEFTRSQFQIRRQRLKLKRTS